MKNSFFTKPEIELILDCLDNISDDPDLSFLYSQIGHEKYAYWYNSVYEKLEAYSSITFFVLAEIEVIRDALLPLDAAEYDELDPNIRSLARSACRKVQNIREALVRGLK